MENRRHSTFLHSYGRITSLDDPFGDRPARPMSWDPLLRPPPIGGALLEDPTFTPPPSPPRPRPAGPKQGPPTGLALSISDRPRRRSQAGSRVRFSGLFEVSASDIGEVDEGCCADEDGKNTSDDEGTLADDEADTAPLVPKTAPRRNSSRAMNPCPLSEKEKETAKAPEAAAPASEEDIPRQPTPYNFEDEFKNWGTPYTTPVSRFAAAATAIAVAPAPTQKGHDEDAKFDYHDDLARKRYGVRSIDEIYARTTPSPESAEVAEAVAAAQQHELALDGRIREFALRGGYNNNNTHTHTLHPTTIAAEARRKHPRRTAWQKLKRFLGVKSSFPKKQQKSTATASITTTITDDQSGIELDDINVEGKRRNACEIDMPMPRLSGTGHWNGDAAESSYGGESLRSFHAGPGGRDAGATAAPGSVRVPSHNKDGGRLERKWANNKAKGSSSRNHYLADSTWFF
ncbi:uncharacterized protein GGS25DRAFT_517530 [Hypoxylon fragiforme]|uniref:uncharacterized protein n=1 Tax=Hypoxylon fragiforme TaxID=63214 RepID=UPI0020C74729|nr:uncharacterized protein GGS25DRAFT_517530 [Hypoxylon fragiforme]KAI2614682.1 hypothetical protein GGS25DRAFT_517530 [Hypoxylon fragiforme]